MPPRYAPAPPNPAEQYFQQASVAIKAGQLEEALGLLTSALQHHARHLGSLQQRSRIYRKRGEFAKALQDINLALEIDLTSNASLIERGRIYHSMNRFEEARGDFQQSIKINPNYYSAYILLGETLIYLKEYRESLEHIDRFLTFNDKEASAYYYRSYIFFHWNLYREALAEIALFFQFKLNRPIASGFQYYSTLLESATLSLQSQQSDSYILTIKALLSQRLTSDTEAVNGRNKYISRRRSASILEMEGETFTEIPGPSQGAHITRFFSNPNQRHQWVVKNSIFHSIEEFREEHQVWNLFYPENPAYFFKFESNIDDFRLVLPRFPGETLHTYLKSPRSLAEYILAWLDFGLELDRFHQLGWIHNDIKPTNVIVHIRPQNTPQTHLIDFGLSMPLVKPFSGFPFCATAIQIAPELFNTNQCITLTPQVDVYGYGVQFLAYYPYKNLPSASLLRALQEDLSQNISNTPDSHANLQKTFSALDSFQKTLAFILRVTIANPPSAILSQIHKNLMDALFKDFPPALASVLKQAVSLTPSNRPSLKKVLEKLMSETLSLPSQEAQVAPIRQLCQWIQHLEPRRFHTLLDVMNVFDEHTQQQFQHLELRYEVARKFHEVAVLTSREPQYQHLNAFVISLIMGFSLKLKEHLSSSFAKHTLFIQPIISLDENHLTQLIHYQESLKTPLGLLVCGMLLDGDIVTSVSERKPDGYWYKRFQDAIVFYIQAGNADAALKPYTTHLLQKKGFFARFESPLKRIQDDHTANPTRSSYKVA